MIEACRAAGLLDGGQAAILAAAHSDFLYRSLTCTMDLRPRVAPWDPSLRQACAGVKHVATGVRDRVCALSTLKHKPRAEWLAAFLARFQEVAADCCTLAQSIGGGGGAGGAVQTGSAAVGVAIGGDGESGGTGSVVTLYNGYPDRGPNAPVQTGTVISTKGQRSTALVAQSIGGGGGSGGSAENSSVGIFNYVVGGTGGNGGSAGTAGTNQVTIYNSGIISTLGNHAQGVVGQAVGGGGGLGGSALALNASVELNINVAVGGSGGKGGTAGDVLATNTGEILTSGADAWGLVGQSVGDGGGVGGMSKADAYTLSVAEEVPSVAIDIGVGGKGGDGGAGGNVGVYNTGLIMTSGAGAHGVLAQSISGGGGAGERHA
ncbi:MAG: hypothetical protein WDW38_011143 [Sanguina aurantia]